jgi:hypothetical protein
MTGKSLRDTNEPLTMLGKGKLIILAHPNLLESGPVL